MHVPDEFRARMAAMLGDEIDDFLAALAAPPVGLRVNTLKIPPERFAEIAPWPLEPLSIEEGFLVRDGRPGIHPYHAAGLYYLQDPGAMRVGAMVPLPSRPRVLDLAAAPGGKSTHLAARMRGEGVLVANDVDPRRARELAGNLERFGVRNAIVTNDTATRLADRLEEWFDVVLVDAPCSGESMFHKSEAALREWSPEVVLGCARRQKEIVAEAARLVAPGGVLAYSTCTFSREENEEVVDELLATRPDFSAEQVVRLWPHRVPGAGHFVALLRREDS